MVDQVRSNSAMKSTLIDMKMEPDIGPDQSICRRDKLSQTVADNISSESTKIIEGLVDQVNSLNPIERLLLYLKLPTKSQGADVDPLRQPLNPLGSRAEITFTINWIKTHLEEDPQISLPKHEVYDEYLSYCSSNSVKPLSTADFGKVMKQVYPQVRPRRLGTRGNSKYCYAGLRKRATLEPPATPDISMEGGRGGEGRDSEEELGTAASFIIREWVEKILQVKFENLTELALHLLDKMYVDNRSSAACTLLSSSHHRVMGGGAPLPPSSAVSAVGGGVLPPSSAISAGGVVNNNNPSASVINNMSSVGSGVVVSSMLNNTASVISSAAATAVGGGGNGGGMMAAIPPAALTTVVGAGGGGTGVGVGGAGGGGGGGVY